LSQLQATLPAGTTRVTSAERAQQLTDRKVAYGRRLSN
jgi:hypothetical protein